MQLQTKACISARPHSKAASGLPSASSLRASSLNAHLHHPLPSVHAHYRLAKHLVHSPPPSAPCEALPPLPGSPAPSTDLQRIRKPTALKNSGRVLAKSSNRNDAGSSSSSASSTSTESVPSPTSVTPELTPAGLLTALRNVAAAPTAVNVYGKPLTKTEMKALDAAVTYLSRELPSAVAATVAAGRAALRRQLLAVLVDAAVSRTTPLPVVEGCMVLLERLEMEGPNGAGEMAPGAADWADGMAVAGAAPRQQEEKEKEGPGLLARYRWQLVVGADIGGVQYIPAVEELEVAPDGASFTLGTDLDFIFTGFSGPCKWLAPGHLSYTVRQVRLEARWPKAWRHAAAWLTWQRRRRQQPGTDGSEPEWGDSLPWSQTCREDSKAPSAVVPLSFFPSNELLTFSCDGRVAATRSALTGGLILLLEVGTREELRGRLRREAGGAV